VFFLIRSLSFTLRQEMETQLPLTRADECVNVDDVLDLSESLVSTDDLKREYLSYCAEYTLCLQKNKARSFLAQIHLGLSDESL